MLKVIHSFIFILLFSMNDYNGTKITSIISISCSIYSGHYIASKYPQIVSWRVGHFVVVRQFPTEHFMAADTLWHDTATNLAVQRLDVGSTFKLQR